ncbi:MAG: hypothetical protein IPJ74_14775 [Saprospiraceae bacterium]|nr:hypothetical protein [Saprospiraceae bacterium]
MTRIIRYFAAITMLLLLIAPLAFGQVAEKTLVKSFAITKQQTVVVDVPGNVEVKTWTNDLLRIQMTITLHNGSESILKSLISAGRYNLVAKESDGTFLIEAPALGKVVQIGGKPLEDSFSITIFAPENVTVKLNNASVNNTGVGSSF